MDWFGHSMILMQMEHLVLELDLVDMVQMDMVQMDMVQMDGLNYKDLGLK